MSSVRFRYEREITIPPPTKKEIEQKKLDEVWARAQAYIRQKELERIEEDRIRAEKNARYDAAVREERENCTGRPAGAVTLREGTQGPARRCST
jgi:hypothetical protein